VFGPKGLVNLVMAVSQLEYCRSSSVQNVIGFTCICEPDDNYGPGIDDVNSDDFTEYFPRADIVISNPR
jgi:hypothetical protein